MKPGDRRLQSTPRFVFALSLVAGVIFVSTSSAQSAAPPNKPASKKEVRLLSGQESAFVQLAREAGRTEVGESSLVVVGPVQVAQAASASSSLQPALHALHERLRTAVASAVPLAKQVEKSALSPILARTAARKRGLPLVYLAPRLSGGELSLAISVTKWPRGFWRRTLAPMGAVTGFVEYRVPADGAIRSLFPRPAHLGSRQVKMPSPMSSPLALACGDVTGNGKNDLVLIDRQEIAVGEVLSGRLQIQTRKSWAELTEISGTPLRSPLAAAAIERNSLMVGLSDRTLSLALDGQLNPVAFGPRRYPLGSKMCAEFTPTGIDPTAHSCPVSPSKPSTHSPPANTDSKKSRDAYVTRRFATPSGTSQTITVQLPHQSSQATLRSSSADQQAQTLLLDDTGSAIALADLDGDGSPEIISSSSENSPSKDHLRIHSYENGKLTLRLTLETEPIHALAVCPFNGENPLSLVAAIGKEIWILE